MSLEISTPKCAQVIMLATTTRVQKIVMITQPLFLPRMCENAISFSSFPFSSFPFIPFFGPALFLLMCSAQTPRLILTLNGSKTWIAARNCLLYVCIILDHYLRGHIP